MYIIIYVYNYVYIYIYIYVCTCTYTSRPTGSRARKKNTYCFLFNECGTAAKCEFIAWKTSKKWMPQFVRFHGLLYHNDSLFSSKGFLCSLEQNVKRCVSMLINRLLMQVGVAVDVLPLPRFLRTGNRPFGRTNWYKSQERGWNLRRK